MYCINFKCQSQEGTRLTFNHLAWFCVSRIILEKCKVDLVGAPTKGIHPKARDCQQVRVSLGGGVNYRCSKQVPRTYQNLGVDSQIDIVQTYNASSLDCLSPKKSATAIDWSQTKSRSSACLGLRQEYHQFEYCRHNGTLDQRSAQKKASQLSGEP